jgi:putative IMPACT (imprinted ancient) family translation regulator
MNDDGEPSGTAGKPIYNQLISTNITNTLIIVVRYFGGTLLGTGGLINAYRSATTDMLNNASIIVRYVEEQFRLSFPYEKLNAVMKLLKDENSVPINPVYESNCVMLIGIRKSLSEQLMQKLRIIGGIHIESL